jgi:hypothetical protein
LAAAPPAHQVPVSQIEHTGGVLAVPACDSTVPAAHEPNGLQSEAFAVELYVAAAQAVHTRSSVALVGTFP